MWIFGYRDFKVKDIVELQEYELQIDEETNAKTIVKILKETTAKDGKTYTNISKIEPVESFVAQQPQTTAAEPTVEAASNASTPNWN